MRLLLVKTSSLGDVIHALAPLTDAAAAVPGLACDWVVEQPYAEIPAWHPAVRRVIPCALRRWRKAPLAAVRSGEWGRFRTDLRRDSYDLVLDGQGLAKSAFLAAQARGPKAGRGFSSSREAVAALFYSRRYEVSQAQDQVERQRELFARALRYPQPRGLPDFGLDAGRFREPSASPGGASKYVVFQHGASWDSKRWSEANWQALGLELRERGYAMKLPSGSAEEQAAGARIAQAFGGEALPPTSLTALAGVLANAKFLVGCDTGVTHLAAALGTRSVSLHGPSVPVISGVASGALVNLCSTDAKTIDRQRPNTVPLEKVREAIRPWLA
jgi:heptosyltransferase-1